MPLVITEEQRMLKSSAREFLKERAPVSALRTLRDSRDTYGYDRNLWAEMAEMGWTGLNIPETYGGLNFGYTGLGQILEETGRTLTASPLMSTVVLGATLIQEAGNVLQKESILPAIAEGKMLLSLAFEEGKRHQPFTTLTTAQQTEGKFVLNGTKTFVLDGHVANKFIVTAQTEQGLSLFLADAGTAGITVHRHWMMDSRNMATVLFQDVKLEGSALIGAPGQAQPILEKVLDVGRICLSAEMLGIIQEAFDRTIAYLKERKQFGVSIGSFQGLQHRAAHLYCEIELCKSIVLKALNAIDQGQDTLCTVASLVKAKTGQVAQTTTNEAIQMFGGIGMTDDEEIGFFLKRARVAEHTLGDQYYHLDRYASLHGF